MTVVAIFPTYITLAVDGNEFISQTATPEICHIKGYTPAVGNTLLHWQRLFGIPVAENIGFSCKVKTLAFLQTCGIYRKGYTAIVPVYARLIELHTCIVKETEQIGLFIITDRRIEPHIVYDIIAVDTVETECVGCAQPFVCHHSVARQQFVTIDDIGIVVAYIEFSLPKTALNFAQRQCAVGDVSVVVKTIDKIHDTVVSDLVFYVEFYESHLCLCFCINLAKIQKK